MSKFIPLEWAHLHLLSVVKITKETRLIYNVFNRHVTYHQNSISWFIVYTYQVFLPSGVGELIPKTGNYLSQIRIRLHDITYIEVECVTHP